MGLGRTQFSLGGTRRPVTRQARSRGQAITEFALLLPVFLVITLGVVDFARVFTYNVAIINAVREGALAPTNATTDTAGLWVQRIEDRVKRETDAAGMDWSLVTLGTPECTTAATPTPPWTSCSPSDDPSYMKVEASYAMDFVTPLLGDLFGSSILVSATTTAPVIKVPEAAPTPTPAPTPTAAPSTAPTAAPSVAPTTVPTASASPAASPSPGCTPNPDKPKECPTATVAPTVTPTATPTAAPTASPTAAPTAAPTATPTAAPTASPTAPPTPACTPNPDKPKECPTPSP